MKWLVDLNIVLDLIHNRKPHLEQSAQILDRIIRGEVRGYVASHEVTTAFYIVRRKANRQAAEDLVDWLLSHFEVIPEDKAIFRQARSLGFKDFADAVIASTAQAAGCDIIVTRNSDDFSNSPVAAVTPAQALS